MIQYKCSQDITESQKEEYMNKLQVLEYEINTKVINEEDYVSLTDIAKKVNGDEPRFVIQNWMRNKDTIDYLGLWEKIYNPNFNRVGFEAVKNEAGRNRFTMSPSKWIKSVDAIGIISKSGKYEGGTYAHFDIAMEFASWISPEFKLYIVTEFKRLKEDELEVWLEEDYALGDLWKKNILGGRLSK